MEKSRANSREASSNLRNILSIGYIRFASEYIAMLKERIWKLEEFIKSKGYDPEDVQTSIFKAFWEAF